MRLGPGWEAGHRRRPGDQRRGAREDPLVHGHRPGRGRDAAHRRRGRDRATGSTSGFFYRPTIFGDVEPGMRIAQEEIFGPTTALIPVKDFDEAIRVANGIRFGLSSSIFTRDVNRAFRAMRDLQTGITYVNAGTIGAEVHLRSAARRTPATATARRARPRSTSSPSGSRSTSTTRASCRRPRSTSPSTARQVSLPGSTSVLAARERGAARPGRRRPG